MRAEAISWDVGSASNASPAIDGDEWHVELAPGDVKVVSLEQLDDLFRLSIVDAETKVWQDGMSEWEPLRVIAGLDEPAPEPKRSYPKPPSPRTLPPSPRPRSVALAPGSFSMALAATEPAFVAPTSVREFASVRPLVVSQVPPLASGRRGGFGRFLIGVALIAGVAVSLYRNGFVREAAHAVHQDALEARLESTLGGPSFGTLRAVEETTEGVQAASPSPTSAASTSANSEASVRREPAVATLAAALRAPTGSMPPVVSLESLAPERAGVARPKPEADLPVGRTPAATPKTAAQVKPQVGRRAAGVEKPQPAPEKPAAQMTERARLNAAIGQAMLTSPTKANKSGSKAKSNEYDPLNPKL